MNITGLDGPKSATVNISLRCVPVVYGLAEEQWRALPPTTIEMREERLVS